MSLTEEKKRPDHLGFLTALGDPVRGLIGGFLILNAVGRPTEFHCTAPVRPNRAQEILYGNTLEGFVCGEQIATALVDRTKTALAAILTNNPNMLTARDLLKAPLGLVFRRADSPLKEDEREKYAVWTEKRDGAVPVAPENCAVSDGSRELLRPFFFESFAQTPLTPGVDFSAWRETTRGKNRLALPTEFAGDGGSDAATFDEIAERLDVFFKSIDSVEPFERIRLAVEEAQKSC